LGVGTGDSPQFAAVNLSDPTGNTLTGSSGRLVIEGVGVPLVTDYLVSAAQYGATGNGVTDDTDAIEAALAAADAVWLPPGTYIVESLTIPSGKGLYGTRQSVLKNKNNSAASTAAIVLPNSTANVNLLGFSIDGNSTNQVETTINGIQCGSSCSDISVLGVKLINIVRNGILFGAGSTNTNASGNILDTIGRFGIVWDYNAVLQHLNLRACDNFILDCVEGSIAVVAGDGVTPSAGAINVEFSGNTAIDCGQGIGGYSPNNVNFRVTNNTIENSGNHGSHLGGTDIVIEGNTIIGAAVASIVISNFPNSAPVQGSGFRVSNNTCRTTETIDNGSGILVQNYDNGVVVGNTIDSVLESAILIEGLKSGAGSRCTNIAVTGNHINAVDDGSTHATSENGLQIKNCDRVVVSGNVAWDTYDSVCALDSVTDSVVVGNVFGESVNSSGILVVDNGGVTPSRDVTIVGNTCLDNNNYGVASSGTTDYLTVRSNTLTGNGIANTTLSGSNNVTDTQIVTLTDTQTLTNKTLTAPRGVYYSLAKSGSPAARNSANAAGDATPQVMATATVPAGAMGPTGTVRWRVLWSYTNSANVKNLRARFGGAGGTIYSAINPTTTAAYAEIREVWNTTATAQVGSPNGISGGLGTTTGAVVTSAENTASAVDIVFTAAWAGATSGETITLEAYDVEVCYGA
jgi:hypothetical protein